MPIARKITELAMYNLPTVNGEIFEVDLTAVFVVAVMPMLTIAVIIITDGGPINLAKPM